MSKTLWKLCLDCRRTCSFHQICSTHGHRPWQAWRHPWGWRAPWSCQVVCKGELILKHEGELVGLIAILKHNSYTVQIPLQKIISMLIFPPGTKDEIYSTILTTILTTILKVQKMKAQRLEADRPLHCLVCCKQWKSDIELLANHES